MASFAENSDYRPAAILFRELGNAPLRAGRPAVAGLAEADAVVIFPIELLPRLSAVEREIGTRSADGDPLFLAANDAGAKRQLVLGEFPGLATIGGDGHGRTGVIR